jgi:hypothetical protein
MNLVASDSKHHYDNHVYFSAFLFHGAVSIKASQWQTLAEVLEEVLDRVEPALVERPGAAVEVVDAEEVAVRKPRRNGLRLPNWVV